MNIQKNDLLINNQFVPSSSGRYFHSINPSTGEALAQIADGTKEDAQKAIFAARKAFDQGPWPKLSYKERGEYLNHIANLIRDNAKQLAELECFDTGKTLKQTTFIDIPTCADTFEYFASAGKELDDKQLTMPVPVESVLTKDAVGVVACVIPWNYPLIMTAWKMAPALIAGNTIVFKPSSLASVSVMELAKIIQQAGLPEGVVNFVTGRGKEVGAELAANAKVDMINFTGGTKTGQEVMKLAAGNTKKICLELGGKSPNIVFADCDFEAALGGTMSAIFMNQGQMCTAGSRLLLEDSIYEKFLAALVERTKKLKIGPAFNFETEFGPVISEDHRKNILSFIEQGKKEGAKLVCGGKIPSDPELAKGFYIEPTIFSDVRNSMTIAQEEIFGPVLSVIRFANQEEAIQIANDSKYGLASMVWTKDLEKAKSVGRKLRCGTVWINTYGGFYNQTPFGGYKQSGIGRELGTDGLFEYTQTKHICTDQTPGGRPLVASWF